MAMRNARTSSRVSFTASSGRVVCSVSIAPTPHALTLVEQGKNKDVGFAHAVQESERIDEKLANVRLSVLRDRSAALSEVPEGIGRAQNVLQATMGVVDGFGRRTRCSTRGRGGPFPSRLLGGAENPSATELLGRLLMRNRAAGLDVGQAALNLLDDVEMVDNIVQRAVIGKAVQEFLNLLLGFHAAPPAAGASQRRGTVLSTPNRRAGSARAMAPWAGGARSGVEPRASIRL
jgi:hypothetical protein